MWTLDNIFVVADGTTRSIAEWQSNDENVEHNITEVNDGNGETFEFDNPTGRPGDVVVYVNGRP